MSKRHYRVGSGKTYNARIWMEPDEIKELFEQVGWLGRSSVPDVTCKTKPYFDKGPGVAGGR